MNGFERRKEQSREDIRRAAEELFSKFGADKVSMNDIARKAGVSQATIYNNFGSKENLVHDYRKTIVDSVASRVREILVWKKSYAEKFEGFLQSLIDIADRYRIEIEDSKPFGNRGPGSDQGITRSRDSIGIEIEDSLLEFVKEGRQQGNVRSDLSDEAVITYIKFFQQGISSNLGIRDRISRDSKLAHDLFSLFMYGTCGQSGPIRQNEAELGLLGR
ncbi:MAG: TetR/AcrR family transcriptional regulator [Chloroflexi bacterium]|nr:TetR/AcrR family transcriptional regulator [Chloroflexota bacterium]